MVALRKIVIVTKTKTYLVRQIPLDRCRMFDCACASDISGLRYWFYASGRQRPNSMQHVFWYNYTVFNWLLTIFVHHYYAQPIHYSYVSNYCEPLTVWSIHLM